MNINITYTDYYLYEDKFEYATEGSAGIDLKSSVSARLYPGESLLIGSAVKLDMSGFDIMAMVVPRSGLGSKGVILGNGVGIIDSDYQGEIKMLLLNRSNEYFAITRGDRVAQLIFVPIVRPKFTVTDIFIPTKRGENGFGSTGH